MGGGSDALEAGDRSPTRGASPIPGDAPAKVAGLPVPSNGGGGGDLLDLEAIFGAGDAAPAAPAAAAVNGAAAATLGSAPAANGAGADLLADVFGATGSLAPSTAAVAAPVAAAAVAAPAAQEEDFGGFEVAPPREEKVVVSQVQRRACFLPRDPSCASSVFLVTARLSPPAKTVRWWE